MGAYEHIKNSIESEYRNRDDAMKSKLINWRKESSVVRVEHPTNIARARELGYKAKQGVIIVRVRIKKGKRKREKPRGGRKPSKNGRFFAYSTSLQSMAEGRASRKFVNCEVLNSYYVGEDGSYRFYEAILLDRAHPAVSKDSDYMNVVKQKGRAYRALTSSGKKHRGL
jgi:large subunit ribosomal protein L15e